MKNANAKQKGTGTGSCTKTETTTIWETEKIEPNKKKEKNEVFGGFGNVADNLDINKNAFLKLSNEIKKFMGKLKESNCSKSIKGKIEKFGVYYKDLNTSAVDKCTKIQKNLNVLIKTKYKKAIMDEVVDLGKNVEEFLKLNQEVANLQTFLSQLQIEISNEIKDRNEYNEKIEKVAQTVKNIAGKFSQWITFFVQNAVQSFGFLFFAFEVSQIKSKAVEEVFGNILQPIINKLKYNNEDLMKFEKTFKDISERLANRRVKICDLYIEIGTDATILKYDFPEEIKNSLMDTQQKLKKFVEDLSNPFE